MEYGADEHLPPVGSSYGGADELFSIVSVHLRHHWLIGMNLLDPDDLKERSLSLAWLIKQDKQQIEHKKHIGLCFCNVARQ